jgi:broad specificity phosphatase PhoE
VPLLLVRHGESEGNAGGIIQGQLDLGLTELGRLQASWTADSLSLGRVAAVVSSPLERSRVTAEVIGARLGLTPRLDERLMEYGFGELSGLNREEIGVRFPQVALTGFAGSYNGSWTPIPGEEGREEFFSRVRLSIDELVAEAADNQVVVVTHGGFLNAACHHILGIDYVSQPSRFHFANCSVTELEKDRAGRLVLKRHNDVCHLERGTDADFG